VLLLVVALSLWFAIVARRRSRRLELARRTDDDVLREQVLERLDHLTSQWDGPDGSKDGNDGSKDGNDGSKDGNDGSKDGNGGSKDGDGAKRVRSSEGIVDADEADRQRRAAS